MGLCKNGGEPMRRWVSNGNGQLVEVENARPVDSTVLRKYLNMLVALLPRTPPVR